MLITTIISSIIFIFAAFISHQTFGANFNPLVSYFLTIVNFIIDNLFIFILLFIFLTIILHLKIKFDKKHHFYKKLLFSTVHIIASFMLGFFISFVLLLVIAVIQLNILSIFLNINPQTVGVIEDKKEIIETLKNAIAPPSIIAADNNNNKSLVAIASATTGWDNIYGRKILQSIPGFFVIPVNPRSSMLLIDNTLIFSELNRSDIQALSPTIGYIFVKSYFPLKQIKAYPKVSIMTKDEYVRFRETDSTRTLTRIDNEILNLKDNVASLSARIASYKSQASASATPDKDYLSKINSDYKNCIASGSKETDCIDKQTKQIQDAKQRENSANTLKEKVDNAEKLISEMQYYEELYASQKKAVQIQKVNAPNETGIFTPTDSISISLDTTNSHAVADYFATLTHEYLHYASFISQDKKLKDLFFEEGLTEYFTRAALKNDLDTSTNLGYPIQARIISEMTNLIPESDFADIYFTKDQAGLEKLINKVYGDDFYKNNEALFASLQSASDQNQLLILTNRIMKKIGGHTLSKKDLRSSYSTL
ncbi:MAG TPA: hypothetical protein VLG67_05035 [Candidatus Saccharimonadales bacterium]|nr:hypothetical protein [Candidatus Saccharimonadales bacterium]